MRELIATMASLYPSPLGVDEVLEMTRTASFADRRTEKLSGGETQRARAAVALVANPDLLVLDEPTAALDVGSRRDFWDTMRGLAAQGKTILFATHYLEEADTFADRIVLMANGKVVADGPTGEIKGMVGSRTIRARCPTPTSRRLPGVTAVERHGATVMLVCTDSDAAIRALLAAPPGARDIEITGAGLEEAFLQLTARMTYVRSELLRALPQPAVLHLQRRLPAGPVLVHRRRRNSEPIATASPSRSETYYMVTMAAYGGDDRGDERGRPDRRRARGGLDAPAAPQPAPVPDLLPHEGRSSPT